MLETLVGDGRESPKTYTDYCIGVHLLVEANQEMELIFCWLLGMKIIKRDKRECLALLLL